MKQVTGEPVAYYPPFLLIESMAQLAGIAVAEREGEGGFLAAIAKGEFFAGVAAGDTLQIAVRVAASFGRLYLVEGEVSTAGGRVAAATFTIGIGNI